MNRLKLHQGIIEFFMPSNIFLMKNFLIHSFFPTRFLGKASNSAIPYSLLFSSSCLMTSICLQNTEPCYSKCAMQTSSSTWPESSVILGSMKQGGRGGGGMRVWDLLSRRSYSHYLKETISNTSICMKSSFFCLLGKLTTKKLK